jgi:hypothetical protein
MTLKQERKQERRHVQVKPDYVIASLIKLKQYYLLCMEQSAVILTTSPENVVLVNFVIELKIEHKFTCSSLLIMLKVMRVGQLIGLK